MALLVQKWDIDGIEEKEEEDKNSDEAHGEEKQDETELENGLDSEALPSEGLSYDIDVLQCDTKKIQILRGSAKSRVGMNLFVVTLVLLPF